MTTAGERRRQRRLRARYLGLRRDPPPRRDDEDQAADVEKGGPDDRNTTRQP